MPLQRLVSHGGLLLMTSGGNLADECCCYGPCDNGWPDIMIKVVASDSNLPVQWCDHIWQPSTVTLTEDNERHSGEEARICPDYYGETDRTFTTNGAFHCYAGEHWRKNLNLSLARGYNFIGWSGSLGSAAASNRLTIKMNNSTHYWGFFGSGYPASMGWNYATMNAPLGILAVSNTPFCGAGYLTGDFFSSYTINGAVHSWRKGSGW